VLARLRPAVLACALACSLGCPKSTTQSPEADDEARSPGHDDAGKHEGDPRDDPSRCSGEGLDLAALVGTGLCTIPVADATALPGPERLELIAPDKLVVAPGAKLEFALLLRNGSSEPLDVDLRFRHFLPLGPESTEAIDAKSVPDPSCTLQPMSTDPPPERFTLPPDAELAIPCEWFANTRLVDPNSYVGSECPDFPRLAPGRYRSIFRITGGAGSQRDVAVEIEVRAAKR
jgi:hypothetical protein